METENTSPDDVSRLAQQEGAAVGVHRAPSRAWTRVLATVGIFLLAGGATYGYYFAKSKADEYSWLAWLAAPEASVSPSASPSWTPFETPSATPPTSPSPTVSVAPPDYRLGTKITVYNDTKIKGLAGKVRDLIKEGGAFTKISTGDWDGAKPPSNVIRYNDEKLRDTVDLLAKILGIKAVAFGLTEETPIEIVLVEDPAPDAAPAPSATT